MAVGLTQLCIISMVLAVTQRCLGKEINSTTDLTKDETSGFDVPWQYDAGSGSSSKSQSASSSKSHGEGTGTGKGYGENVRKEKGSYGHSDDSSESGYNGPRKQKVHVFTIKGPGVAHSSQSHYGSQYSKPEPYDNREVGYGGGRGYGNQEGTGYSAESYEKSGESEPQHHRPYIGLSHSPRAERGHSPRAERGHSSNSGYRKAPKFTYARFQNYGGGSSASSEKPDYQSQSHSHRQPQFRAQNQQLQEKINEQLSVFIRQLGNIPLPKFPGSGGDLKKDGGREGYLLLPVLPNDKQHENDDSKVHDSRNHDYAKSGDSSIAGPHTHSGVYSSEEQEKDTGSAYSGGYGLNPQLVSTFDESKQSYPESQESPLSYAGNPGPSQTIGQYNGGSRSKKYLLTFNKNGDSEGSNYGGIQKEQVIYASIPSEGNNEKYDELSQKINLYEQKLHKETSPYSIPQRTKTVEPVRNNYYENQKIFKLKPYGEKYFVVPEQSIAPSPTKDYDIDSKYHSLRTETTSSDKSNEDDSRQYSVQYIPQSQSQVPNLNPRDFNRPKPYEFTNVRVKNPNAHLYRSGKNSNQYTSQNIPDVGFDIGRGYEQQLRSPQQDKHVINHDPVGVSVMYKNTGHHLGGLGGLHSVPSFVGGAGQQNFHLGGSIGYNPGSQLFTHADALQLRQMAGMQTLYNRPRPKTKSIALFLSKPDQFRSPADYSAIMGGSGGGGGLANQYKSPLTNFNPGMSGKYRNNLMPYDLYSGLHGLGSSLSPIIHTDLINLY